MTKKLYTYASDEPLRLLGTFTCKADIADKCTESRFFVIDGNGTPLLGRDTAKKLDVLRIGQ